jgi:sugar phosphate isomerase/epimerase
MLPPLSLHQITAIEAQPPQLVDIAAATGCKHVCAFVHVPAGRAADAFPVIDERNIDAMRSRCAATGVSVLNLEFFYIQETVEPEFFIPYIELGASLGATRATTFIFDKDWETAIPKFRRLCDLAGKHGVMLGIEFPIWTGYDLWRTLDFIEKAGHENAGIVMDPLHLTRTGGTAADLKKVDPRRIGYAQICDGPLTIEKEKWRFEALHDRKLPGTASFPLVDIFGAMPPMPVCVEVPMTALKDAGQDGLARATLAVEATRKVLAKAWPQLA